MAYYVLDANKNLKEGLDKEGIYAMLEQAIEDGDLEHVDADSAFVSKLKDLNGGQDFKVWIGTTAEYNAIQEKTQNTLYLLTDDNLDQELTDIEQDVDTLQTSVDDLATEHTTLANRIEEVNTSIGYNKVQVVRGEISSYTQSSTSIEISYPNGKSYGDIIAIAINFKGYQCSILLDKELTDTTGDALNLAGIYNSSSPSLCVASIMIIPRTAPGGYLLRKADMALHEIKVGSSTVSGQTGLLRYTIYFK